MIKFWFVSTELDHLIQHFSYMKLLSTKLKNHISTMSARIQFIDISKFLKILMY